MEWDTLPVVVIIIICETDTLHFPVVSLKYCPEETVICIVRIGYRILRCRKKRKACFSINSIF